MTTSQDDHWITRQYSPRVYQWLEDFLRHAETAARFVQREDREHETAQLAARMIFIDCGETVYRIDRTNPEFLMDFPELELRDVYAMRNISAHGYNIVNYDVIWDALENDIPRIADKIRAFLNSGIRPDC